MSGKPDDSQAATVAAVDAAALQDEALAALAHASTSAEVGELRGRYLGRKSELKQALRNVRDRETGMTLNAVRERLEQAFAEREAALGRAELDAALATLRERGATTLEPIEVPEGPMSGQRSAYVVDPWGNHLELVERR
jgi:phenylalanyl-tRNA synthetase alpha chain